MLILKMSHLKFAAWTISSIDNVLYTAWNISTKLIIIEFFDTLREVNIYIYQRNMGINSNQFID